MDNSTIESFRFDLVRQINKYRNNHGANNLTNDSKIDKIAQKFADKLSQTGTLDYSYNQYKGEDLGESVYESEIYLAPLKLAKIFYDENIDYNYKSKDPEPSNFTQMVWKNSQLIGFGMQKSSDGRYFFVLNYYPTGNVDGQFKKNVFPSGTKVSEASNNKKKIKDNKNDKIDVEKESSSIKNNVEKQNNEKEKKSEDKNTKKEKEKKYKKNIVEEEEEESEGSYDDAYSYKYVSSKKKHENDKQKENKDKSQDKDKEDKKNILDQLINNKKKDIKDKKDKETKKNILSQLINNKIKEIEKNEDKNETETENDHQLSSTDYASTSEFDDFCLEALDAHNAYRRKHHVGPLKLNKDICVIAQNYAEKLANEIGHLKHSENCYHDDILGENLHYCEGMEATGSSVTKNWYGENRKHNYSGDWKEGTGHFTQIVWKDTTEVGFGKCENKRGRIFVVGNYYPAGNVLGFFKYNVFKP